MSEKEKDMETEFSPNEEENIPQEEENTSQNGEATTPTDENSEEEDAGGWKFEASAPTLEKSLDLGENYELTVDESKDGEQQQDGEPQPESEESTAGSIPQGDEEFREKSKNAVIVNKRVWKIIGIVLACLIGIGVIAGACYALFFVPNSDERMTPGNIALTVGDEDISVGMYNYYYNSIVETYINYAQQGYVDLNPNEDFASQTTTDDDGNQITWLERFKNDTVRQLQYFEAFYTEAKAEGITLTDEQKQTIEDNIKSIEDSASEKNESTNSYIAETFGKYCGLKTVRKIMEQSGIYQNYYNRAALKLSSTDEEVQAYFDKHKDDYKAASFAYLEMPYNPEEDDVEQVKKQAQSYCSQIKSLADMKALIPKICSEFIDEYVSSGYFEDEKSAVSALEETMENTNYTKEQIVSTFNEDMADWVFSADTKVGDSTYFVDDEFKCVAILLKTADPSFDETKYYSVRHILIFPGDSSADDAAQSEDQTEKQYTQEEWKQGLEKAQTILDEYNKGEKTEMAFAELAEKYSGDVNSILAGGYNNYGGQIFNTARGQMVPEFENWATDSARKYGDVEIVKSDYGYHIMYFVCDRPAYLCSAKQDSDYEKQEAFADKYEVVIRGAFGKTAVAQPLEADE